MIHVVVCVCVRVPVCVCVLLCGWCDICQLWECVVFIFPAFCDVLIFFFSCIYQSHCNKVRTIYQQVRPIDWLAVCSDHVIIIVMLLFTHNDTRCASFFLPLAKHAVVRQERLTASGPHYWQPVYSDYAYYS